MVNPTYIISSIVDKIVENSPFPTILPIVSEPNYETIVKVHFKLNAIYASIQYNIGIGQIVFLF